MINLEGKPEDRLNIGETVAHEAAFEPRSKQTHTMRMLQWVVDLTKEIEPRANVALVELGDCTAIVANGPEAIVAILAEGHVKDEDRGIPITKFVQLTHMTDDAKRREFVKRQIVDPCFRAGRRMPRIMDILGGTA